MRYARIRLKMTCKFCKVAMKQEQPSHLFHGKRKFRCPDCNRVRMQKPKALNRSKGGLASTG